MNNCKRLENLSVSNDWHRINHLYGYSWCCNSHHVFWCVPCRTKTGDGLMNSFCPKCLFMTFEGAQHDHYCETNQHYLKTYVTPTKGYEYGAGCESFTEG